MDVQEIAVIVLFVLALVYVARVVYRSVKPSVGGCSQCSKCAVDFSKVKTEK